LAWSSQSLISLIEKQIFFENLVHGRLPQKFQAAHLRLGLLGIGLLLALFAASRICVSPMPAECSKAHVGISFMVWQAREKTGLMTPKTGPKSC